MRPRLPLVLLSALLACFISPSWSDYTLTGNGETTISFADGQYTITPPEGDPVTQADSPGDIYLTDITASGTYEDGYNRVLNLEEEPIQNCNYGMLRALPPALPSEEPILL